MVNYKQRFFFCKQIITVSAVFSLCIGNLDAQSLKISKISTIKTGGFATGAAEISAYDAESQRVIITNAEINALDIYSITNPAIPQKITSIDCSVFGGRVNSVAVKRGLVAAAIEAEVRQDNGSIVFFDTDGNFLKKISAGAQPDMVTFTPDGKLVLSANKGKPDDDYVRDPEGSVTIVNISHGLKYAKVRQVTFDGFNRFKEHFIKRGIRIFGPNATVSQDLEPEYITVGPYEKYAYVTLQTNNAIAVIDIHAACCTRIFPLGLKDHSADGNGFDVSDKDKKINIKNWPVYGIYEPDAIASFLHCGIPFLITVNEGDSRDYDGFSEEARIKDIKLDPGVFPNAMDLLKNENLGRLKISIALADTNERGEFKKLLSYGARSFSILDVFGNLIYESGEDFEKITANIYPDDFNSNNEEGSSFDGRSDDKGPEPEALTIGSICGITYAFIGLERVGGIMIYNISNPKYPEFTTYVNNRDFDADIQSPEAGDLGVECLVFVDAKDSPSGAPLLISSNEISGTVTIFQVSLLAFPDVASTTPVTISEHNGVVIQNGGYGSSMSIHPFLNDYFYLMTDRGPNVSGPSENGHDVKIFTVPGYVPQIGLFRLNGSKLDKVTTIVIKDNRGNPISGLPNPSGMGATGEIAKDLDGNYLGEDANGLDPEGLVAASDGTFWISDEYGPHLVHLDATGKEIERINPFGTGTGNRRIPAVYIHRCENKGMEGITMTPSGKIVGIMQSVLLNPNSSVKKTSKNTRILVLNPENMAVQEFLYLQEVPSLSNSEIRAISETEFIVLERDGDFPGTDAIYKRLYRISLDGATDITDPDNSENGRMIDGKTLEQCTEEELATFGIVPVSKVLVLDLLTDLSNYPHDKPEGFAVLNNNQTIAIINDDDFGILGDDEGGIIQKMLPLTGQTDRNIMYFKDISNKENRKPCRRMYRFPFYNHFHH
jgi:hypothetical protein